MEVKKAKVWQKKVWKPKEAHLKELKKNVDLKALHVEVNKVIENIHEERNVFVSDTEKVNIEKEGNGSQLESMMLEKIIDDLTDLTKQMVIYQRMEDRWGDLDDKIVLEEGKILAESRNQLEEGDLHNIQSKEI